MIAPSLDLTPHTLIPELLSAAPQAREVLNRYGLRGCGGPLGPYESLEFFASAHDVPLDRLLREIEEAVSKGLITEVTNPAEELGDSIYRPFFRAGIAVVLTLGAAWGALLLWRIGQRGSFAAATLHEVNAHGHAQIFGWVGLFVMGFAYQAFPRFKHTSLAHPRLAYATLGLMLGGLVCRSLLEPLVTSLPLLGVPAVAGSVLEIVAIGIFVGVIVATLRGSGKRLEFYDGYILAALAWFFLQAVYETVYFSATILAPDREHLLRLVATLQGPLREIQIHGFALMMILGVSQRMFHYFYGFPAAHARRSLAALAALNVAIIGEVAGFILMREVGHSWAALWYGSILLLAATVVLLVSDWHIFSRPRESDRSLKFLRTAYVWLFLSLGMLVLLPAYEFGVLRQLAPESLAAKIGFSHAYYGAIRHAITVGFVSLMIMGVAAKVVPTLAGRDVRRLGGLWLPFLLINTGCALRVTMQVLTDFSPSAFPVAGVSGLLELTALACWGIPLWRLMSAGTQRVPGPDFRGTESSSAANGAVRRENGTVPLAPLGPITADAMVGDVLDQYPWLLDTFASAGFGLLRNRLLRNTVARWTTIAQACDRMGVDKAELIETLNSARAMPSPPDPLHGYPALPSSRSRDAGEGSRLAILPSCTKN